MSRLAKAATRNVNDIRHGRTQRKLSAAATLSALLIGIEIYVDHYGGSFGNEWMWTRFCSPRCWRRPELVG
ncbi:MAG TPA: hypothetical protein VG325_11190 [Solirubrobacteraceae bacterium]|jgi:hypothetical protein|nr:hypothetical protein [Solirubrobacteraceae bacterium]